MLSRIENILQSIVDSSEYDGPVQSRIEQLLLDIKSVISAGGSGGVTEATVSTMITTAINSLIDSAPDEYNTLGKIAADLLLTDEQIQTITEQVNDRYTKEETNELVSKIPKFTIEVVTSLPTENISTTTVYLKTGSKSDHDNIYDEYIYVKSKWELLGSQTVDLSGYVTTDALTTALENIDDELSNKLDKSGGTLTGALTTQNVNVNGTVSQGNVYAIKILGKLDIGAIYDDLDSKYKDGTYHRMWRIRLKTNINDGCRIKVTLKSSWNRFNAMGTISKTINCGYNNSIIYNNVGYYDSLGYLTEKEFRISELIWNDTSHVWEILIWQKNLSGNNEPLVMLEFLGNIIDATVLPVELTQMTSYTAPKASPTGGDKVVNWEDTPVFETPYGKEVATTDLATTSTNGLMSKDDKKKLDGIDAIVVDDSISTTSTNAIQNKAVGLKFQGVDSEISVINSSLTSKTAEIDTIVNEYGSKNLLSLTNINNSNATGIDVSFISNGGIWVHGTKTTNRYGDIYFSSNVKTTLKPNTKYTLTSVNSAPNAMTVRMHLVADKKTIYIGNNASNVNKTSITFTTPNASNIYVDSYAITVTDNNPIDVTVYPMLRYEAIKDDTYVPYAMTNRELTEKVADTGWITTGNLKYRKSGYIVALQGTVTPSDSTMSITLGTLPENYRPSQDINIAQAGTDTPSRYIAVHTGGDVELIFISNCTVSHTYSYNGIFMV